MAPHFNEVLGGILFSVGFRVRVRRRVRIACRRDNLNNFWTIAMKLWYSVAHQNTSVGIAIGPISMINLAYRWRFVKTEKLL